MTPEILKKELVRSAEMLGWTASDVPSFTAKHFRGKADDVKRDLPHDVLGIRLGAYPVLVAGVRMAPSFSRAIITIMTAVTG
jgi:hypothetical protein